MKLHAHLNFGGRCEAAFHFYESCFGARIITLLSWGSSPMAAEVPVEWHSGICHATLAVGDTEIAGVDDPFTNYETPKGFSLLLETDQSEEAERVFAALAENGTVTMPLQKTFWSTRFGILVDQFGISWEVNCMQAT